MLSDDQLLVRLKTLCRVSRRVDARVVELLIDVEDRRLDLRMACGSLWDFCRRTLGMSEGTTQRRIEAVRAVQKMPRLLGHIASGAVTLGGLALVRAHLTEDNAEELIAAIAGKTRKQIEELLVLRAPRPDVAARLRLLPAPAAFQTAAAPGAALAVTPVATGVVIPSAVAAPFPSFALPPSPAERASFFPERPRLEPLAPQRWKLQLTADAALHDQLERAQALMRHRNPSGDLAVIVAAAVDLLVEKLERERLAARKRMTAPRSAPQPAASPSVPQRGASPSVPRDPAAISAASAPQHAAAHASPQRAAPSAAPRLPASSGTISRGVRRAVFARDGERCTYVDARGERCPSRTWLELDHIDARGLGGSGTLENLRVRCRAHNHLHAEVDFGRHYIARKIRERRARRAEPPP